MSTQASKRKAKHEYIAVNKLERKIGIELTWVPGHLDGTERPNAIDNLCGAYRLMFANRIEALKIKTWNIGTDPQCVEIPTKPISSRANLRRTIDALYGVADSLGFVPNYPWHGGGGAHVHVQRLPSDAQDGTTKALLLDVAARPYITWAFCNPGDNCGARPLAPLVPQDRAARLQEAVTAREAAYTEKLSSTIAHREQQRLRGMRCELTGADLREYVLSNYEAELRLPKYKLAVKRAQAALAERLKVKDFDHQAAFERLTFHNNSSYAVCLNSVGGGTYEWRVFKAPDSPHEHELHVNFALAYMERAKQQAQAGKFTEPKFCAFIDLAAAWPYERSALEFRKLIKTLGLKWADYRHYLDNMKRRYDLGMEYIK